jgi:hypothetical protein
MFLKCKEMMAIITTLTHLSLEILLASSIIAAIRTQTSIKSTTACHYPRTCEEFYFLQNILNLFYFLGAYASLLIPIFKRMKKSLSAIVLDFVTRQSMFLLRTVNAVLKDAVKLFKY